MKKKNVKKSERLEVNFCFGLLRIRSRNPSLKTIVIFSMVLIVMLIYHIRLRDKIDVWVAEQTNVT